MARQSGAARRPEAQGAQAQGPIRPDALAYWHWQETTPLDAGGAIEPPPADFPDADAMASGWWLLPVLVLSVPAWAALLIALF